MGGFGTCFEIRALFFLMCHFLDVFWMMLGGFGLYFGSAFSLFLEIVLEMKLEAFLKAWLALKVLLRSAAVGDLKI